MERPASSIGRLRAPRGSGELLVVPALVTWPDLARRNSDGLQSAGACLGGQTLAAFRRWTRQAVLEAARDYVHSLQPPANVVGRLASRTDGLLFVGGHQPILAHPGVWAKNVAAFALARQTGGASLNLIVDNDTAERTSIDLPAGTRDEPRYQPVPFDLPSRQQPWEELKLRSVDEFRSFGGRVAEQLLPWNFAAELNETWGVMAELAQETSSLSELLTRARLLMEWRRGIASFELPVSRLAALPPFHAFVAHIASHAAEFLAVHNAALAEYRQHYRLHSARHPVPDLEQKGEWTELPFWIWRSGEHRRQRLYARKTSDGLSLTGEAGPIATLPLPGEGTSHSGLVEQFARLQQTWKIRPRALSLTLFARVALADLFIHGIGGAKYDEVTDRIIEKFFGITPPAYSVLTATLHLPLGAFEASTQSVSAGERMLRDMEFNPHQFTSGAQASSLVTERNQLVAELGLTRRQRQGMKPDETMRQANRQRHRRLKEIREELASSIVNARREIESRLAHSRREAAANRVLKNREFATVLFPPEQLDRLVSDIELQAAGDAP